jgi:hypothetical protein
MACKPDFVEDEQDDHQTADSDEADYLWRVPGEGCASKVEAEQ